MIISEAYIQHPKYFRIIVFRLADCFYMFHKASIGVILKVNIDNQTEV